MKALVAGGAGFIGSFLCEELVKNRDEVVCIDNLGSGNKEHIKYLLEEENFTFIKHDVTKPLEIDESIDQIYHIASRASPIDYQKYPIETALANSTGTHNMLELALEKNAVILFGSTSETYGDPKVHPQNENYWGNVNPIGLRSCYDESKRFGETLIMVYHRKKKAKVKIVRIFNTYGPRMRKDDGRVTPNFIMQALKNEAITIYGDGSQTRSFCYISDMINGLTKMMNSKLIGPINLGNPHEITILELARKIREIIDSKSEFVFKQLPSDDPVQRQPDILKARKLLHWKPEVSLENGLKRTIEYFKNNYKVT